MRLLYLFIFTLINYVATSQIPVPGNVLWLKADAAVYNDAAATVLATNGQTAAQWNDQSGNAAHAICTPVGYRPTYVTNAINGKPVLRFSNHYMQTPNIDLSATDKSDVYVVYKSVEPNSNWECVVEHGADFNTYVGFNIFENAQTVPYTGIYTGSSGGGYNTKNYPFKTNEFKIVNSSFDKAAAVNAKTNLRINSKDITLYNQNNASGSGNFANYPLYIGNRGNAVGSYPLSGDIAEIILYNRKLTPAEKTQIESYLNTKYNITCNVTTPQPGSGNCLQMGTYGAFAQDDADIDFGSNDFTVEFWTMKRALTSSVYNSQCVNKWNSGNVPGSNEWAIATSSDGFNNIPSFNIESGTTIYKADATTSLPINKWYHIAAVREGNNLKIYVNGILEGTTAIPPGTSVNNVAARTFMSMGYIAAAPYYSNNSNLDELRIWNTALSQTTIRNWMCKKETASHPNHAFLTRYYKFDETSGTIFGNQINNCVTEAYSNGGILTTSGAPIGDNSAYDYTANVGTANINIGTPSDNFTATMNTGTSAGVHVYGVNELPNNQNLPGLVGNNKYAGVFVINGNGTAAYNATYNYTNNTAVTPSNEPALKLFKRTDNAATAWSAASNQTLNTTTKTISATGQNTEYILASAVTPIPPTCALNLSGVAGEGVQVANNAAINLTTAYTYEAWIKASTDISTWRAIINRNGYPNYSPGIYVASSTDVNPGKLRVDFNIGAVAKVFYSTTSVNDNQWHHIATTYDGANMKIYIDGILENTLAATGALLASTAPLGIGYNYSVGNYPFIGKIDEVRIWNVARNISQISSTMNTTLAGNETGLAAYYNFNGGIYNGSGMVVPNNCTNTGAVLNGFTTGTSTTPTFDCPNTTLPALVSPICAAKFNGTTSRVDVGSLGTMPNKGTIEFWINQPSFSDWQIPLSTQPISTTSVDGIIFQTYATGQLVVGFGNAANNQVYTSFGNLTANRNYHVAVTWDLTSLTYKGYLDGRLIFTSPLTYYPTTLPRLTLGAGYFGGRYYNGTLDEVRYWNVERSQTEIINNASSVTGTETGLQAYYHFNENNLNGNGQTVLNKATATGASLNGITVNYVKFPCSQNPPTCGITLSGAVSEGVQVPHNAAFNSTTNITYEAWVKPGTNVAGYRRIVGKGGNGTQEAPGIYVQQTTGKLTAGILINGVQQIVTSTLAINDNEWHHTAFTYDGTTLKLYVDGTLDGTLTAAGTITTNTSPLDIGYNSPLNLYPFIGKIDEVRVWNTTRTLSEIQTAINGPLLGNETGLIAYYHFNDNNRSGQNRTVTNFCTATGSALNGSTFGTALTPVFDCAPPPFTNPECNMQLNGTTDYVTVPNNAALNLSKFSVGAYVKTTDASGNYKNIVWKDVDGSNANYALYITNTNKAQFTFQRNPISGTAPNATGTTTITDGNWHYLVGTYDGANLKIYVDGLLEATTADASVPMMGPNSLYLGSSAGANKYNGSMDELSVWNRALSVTEITGLIGQRLVGNETGLVAYYNFNNNHKNGQAQTVINECSGTGAILNGTSVGTASTPIFTCSDIVLTTPNCAMLFNGNGDKAIVGGSYGNNAFAGITQNFTVEIKAKPLVQKGGSSGVQYDGIYANQKYAIFPDNGGSLYGGGHAGSGLSIGTNGVSLYEHSINYIPARIIHNRTIDDWIHVTIVYKNGAPSLYENGALISTASASGYLVHPSAIVSGYYGDFGGYISEIRVWDRSLTNDEVRANLNTNLTGSEANLAALYRFDNTGADGNNKTINSYGSIGAIATNKLVTTGSANTPLFTCSANAYPLYNTTGAGHTMGSGNLLGSQPNFAEMGNWGAMPNQGTISLWSYYATAAVGVPIANQNLLSTSNWNTDSTAWKGIRVVTTSTGGLDLVIGDDNSTNAGNSNTFTIVANQYDLKWHHLSITWNKIANNIAVYFDGIQKLNVTNTKWPTTFSNVRLGIGNGTTSATNFSGYIDECSFWNKQLTLSEVRDRMSSKIAVTDALYGNLIHYYRFDDNDASGFIQDFKGTKHGVKYFGKNFFWSGAPIGDVSSYSFAGNSSSATTTCSSPSSDNITATMTNGNADGIIVYGNNDYANTLLFVTDTIGNNNRYLGVHVINGDANAAYSVVYNYTGNPTVTTAVEPNVKLFYRTQHYILNAWSQATASLNTLANTITATGQSTQYVLGKTLSALPVKWLSFKAWLNSNKQTELNWKLAGETNVKQYEVEWSTDGSRWNYLATIPFNVLYKGDYKAVHLQPVAGVNFYRIRQVDLDGKFSYSTIQSVSLAAKTDISIYPNPATDIINITGWNNIVQLQLFDISGRKIQQWQTPQSIINIGALSKGTYILKIDLITGQSIKQKIVLAK